MTLNLIDKIGDYNPQLFREIKGSWKTFNVVIALAISLISQAGVVLYQFGDFPNETYSIHKPFCNLTTAERFNFEQNSLSSAYCPLENIDMQGWWQNCWENIFMALSVMFIFTLLVPGTYLLINNLAQEESRGTFNNFSSSQTARNKSWWHDFIWGEKSPSLVAIMINLLIVTTPLVIWILLAPVLNIHHNDSIDWVNSFGRIKAILAVVFFISLMMIYATLAQIILLMKNPKPSFWAIGIVGAAMFFPPIILGTLGITHDENSLIWLFSTFPWAGMKNSAISSIFMALLAEFSILALLNIRLIKQVKLAGESATKALLTGR
ncbi:hypothetical protein [Nostoc sp. CCY0012]|uniref:hypothetical protein n=1 Tax=Nostoc sp. CCY0012 TaxID=1056123 RepID=UPI0039C63D19